MSYEGIKNIIEALIFASEDELSLKEVKGILDNFKITISLKEIESAIDELNSEYEKNGNAFEIIRIASGYQFATRKKYSHFLGKLITETQRKKLSQSAIETLAIIAYKQPITRSDIEFVRGVNVDYIVNSLLERDLITIKGRADSPGRPILYGTTTNFLRVLGLNSLDEMPKLKEINDILKNEKIEGISEADIDLFNSMSISDENKEQEVKNDIPQIPFENTENVDNSNEENDNNESTYSIPEKVVAENKEDMDENIDEFDTETDDYDFSNPANDEMNNTDTKPEEDNKDEKTNGEETERNNG